MDSSKLLKVLVFGALSLVACDSDDGGETDETETETGESESSSETGSTSETGDTDSTSETGETDSTDETDATSETESTDETGDTGEPGECCPEECWIGPCDCTGGVCCWLVPPDHPGCEQQC